jgi:lactate dehydrogenase-like 2-hydroxyacid dehydrogenase
VLTPHLATLTKESRLEMEIQATQNLLIELNQ